MGGIRGILDPGRIPPLRRWGGEDRLPATGGVPKGRCNSVSTFLVDKDQRHFEHKDDFQGIWVTN